MQYLSWARVDTRAYLAAYPAGKDTVDEGGLCHICGGPGLDTCHLCLMHRIQQGYQILMGILLTPLPEAVAQGTARV